eukprot:COSAG02_NODE_49347_length_327_cov_0.934211_1_plen_64_part_01
MSLEHSWVLGSHQLQRTLPLCVLPGSSLLPQGVKTLPFRGLFFALRVLTLFLDQPSHVLEGVCR